MFSAFRVKFRRFCGALLRTSGCGLSKFRCQFWPTSFPELSSARAQSSAGDHGSPIEARFSKCTPFEKGVLLRRCEKLLLRASLSPCVMEAPQPVMESWFHYLRSVVHRNYEAFCNAALTIHTPVVLEAFRKIEYSLVATFSSIDWT